MRRADGMRPVLPRVVAALVVAAGLGLAGCGSTPRTAMPVTREPDTASRIRVAKAAEASGQIDVALSMYGAAVEAAPDDPEALRGYAGILARAGRPDQAEPVLARALQRRPEDPVLLVALGRQRLRMGAAAEALAAFDRVLARRPVDAAALDGRGVALDLLGHHGEAQQSYRAAQAAAPNEVAPANNLAMSLILDGQPATAATILSAVAARPGAPPRVVTNLGIAQAAAGDRGAAQATLAGRVTDDDLDGILASLGGTAPRPAMAAAQMPVHAVPRERATGRTASVAGAGARPVATSRHGVPGVRTVVARDAASRPSGSRVRRSGRRTKLV